MSCDSNSTRLSIVQGDTGVLRIPITQADCETAQDLTEFTTIVFTLKRSTQDSDAAALFRGTLAAGDIEVLDPASDGVIEITIPPEASVLMRIGRPYYWDVEIRSDAEHVYTPSSGTLLATLQSSKGT